MIHDSTPPESSSHRRAVSPATGAALIVCLLSLALCYVQGAKRAVFYQDVYTYGSFDFAVPYTAARCWLLGRSPYDENLFLQTERESGIPHAAAKPGLSAVPDSSPYPPNQLSEMAPIAAVPWASARIVWWTLGFLMLGVIFALSAGLFAGRLSRPTQLLLIAALAQSRIIHLTSYRGQNSLLVFGFIMLGTWWVERRRVGAGGVAFGLSLLKFTYTLPLLAYYAVPRRQWRVVGIAIAVAVLLGVLGLSRIGGGHAWHEFRAVWPKFLAPGAVNDTSPLNPGRDNIDNISIVLFDLLGNRLTLINAVYMALLFAAALLIWLLVQRSPADAETRSLDWAIVTMAGYIFLYHRFYDAVVLFPITFVIANGWKTWRKRNLYLPALTVGTLLVLLYVLSVQSIDESLTALAVRFLPLPLTHLRFWFLTLLCAQLIGIHCDIVKAARKTGTIPKSRLALQAGERAFRPLDFQGQNTDEIHCRHTDL